MTSNSNWGLLKDRPEQGTFCRESAQTITKARQNLGGSLANQHWFDHRALSVAFQPVSLACSPATLKLKLSFVQLKGHSWSIGTSPRPDTLSLTPPPPPRCSVEGQAGSCGCCLPYGPPFSRGVTAAFPNSTPLIPHYYSGHKGGMPSSHC